MNDPTIKRIKEFIINEFNSAYGYCGVAENETFLMLNSGDDDKMFIIKIEEKD